MDKAEATRIVRDIIAEVCDDEDVLEDPDMDLFDEGFLDSMAAIELLVDLEDRLGVSIDPTELDRAEMNTVNLIVARTLERL